MLKKIKSDSVCQTKFISIDKHILEDSNSKQFEYFTVNTSDGVLVIPIRIKENKISFILTKQFRVAAGIDCIEFPKGAIDRGEAPEEAAKRELLEETGFKAEWIKFFYSFFSLPPSPNKLFVYLALVTEETPAAQKLDALESATNLHTLEVTADELLKMIKTNEIVDGQSLAALTTVMLQTGAAAQYLETLGG